MMGSLASLAGDVGSGSESGARPLSWHVVAGLLAVAAFAVYWASSFHLAAAHRTTHFAADTWFYAELARDDVVGRIADTYHLDRIFRFHPTTVVLAVIWMKIVGALSAWIAPQHLLKALFATVGAVGAWAATWAFAAVVPRRSALLLGAMYASSLSVWYFSSIEESKIVTATLTALYIATYLHLRKAWTVRGALLLTGILLLACLNEITAALLIVIPLVDTLVQRGWRLSQIRWLAAHALAAPVALAILESLMRGRTGAAGYHPEGATHFSMFFYYFSQNNYNWDSIYTFAARWLLFSIAAPSTDGAYGAEPGENYGGDFEPALAHYFASPVSAALVTVFIAALVVSLLPRYRGNTVVGLRSVLLALLAYAVLRGAFFLAFIPYESTLFSVPVVLAHLLLVGIPIAVSRFPARQGLLAALAALLLLTNAAFFVAS